MPHLAASPAPSAGAAPDSSSRRRQTMAGPGLGTKAPATPASAPAAAAGRRQTMAGFGGKAAPAPGVGKASSRLARTQSAGRDAPATSRWSILAAFKPAAPANTCTDLIHANQCTALMALPLAPSCQLIVYTPPAALRLPAAFAAPAAPASAATAAWPTLDLELSAEEAQCLVQPLVAAPLALAPHACTSVRLSAATLSRTASLTAAAIEGATPASAAESCESAAAPASAAAAWPTLDLELSAEEALCLVQLTAPEAAPLALAPRTRRPAALLSGAAAGLRALARKLASLSCLAQPAVAA